MEEFPSNNESQEVSRGRSSEEVVLCQDFGLHKYEKFN